MLFFLNILTNQVSPCVATLILVKCTLISCQLLDDANCFTRNLKSICRSLSWFLGLLVQPRGVRLFVCSTNLFRLRSLHSCQRENVSWNIKQTVPKRCQWMCQVLFLVKMSGGNRRFYAVCCLKRQYVRLTQTNHFMPWKPYDLDNKRKLIRND